ncbi:TetR/AcrR family transcriptional regulator [Lichenicola sp.]|uniref:TetR/AcrR family transcriptional regulator n=1 Tax=Lichenicola sp. TaxID=2804529 RepID=UPI003B00637D
MTETPTPPRKRTTKAAQRADTTELILDAAEHLFSRHGFYGVTLKDVAGRVGVHHTLLNYYFDDKPALFEAVFARRAAVSVSRRMQALDEYEAACNGSPTVEGAVHAFLDTDFDLYIEGGESWKNYGALGAQVASTPEWGADLMNRHFDPVVMRLIGLLRQALPDCPPEDIFWGYHFITGALLLTLARTGRIDTLSGGLCRSDDFPAVKARMARFMAAGLVAMCSGPTAPGNAQPRTPAGARKARGGQSFTPLRVK